jgi:hypothetical protein
MTICSNIYKQDRLRQQQELTCKLTTILSESSILIATLHVCPLGKPYSSVNITF